MVLCGCFPVYGPSDNKIKLDFWRNQIVKDEVLGTLGALRRL